MSDEAQRQFFNKMPPTESNTVGVGVTFLATSVTAAKLDLSGNPGLFDRNLELTAHTGTIWVSFSSDGVTDISKAFTPGSTLAGGTNKQAPMPIYANTTVVVRLDTIAQRWLHFQAEAATPTLIIVPRSQPRLADITSP